MAESSLGKMKNGKKKLNACQSLSGSVWIKNKNKNSNK